jgi:hypothetical protein|tara:strand:- start:765 stop:1088 length:324 start_codon:yes stop_codon:yes gene_type:complete
MYEKRYRNDQVITFWKQGKKAKNHKETLETDGLSLWSYRLEIGRKIGSETVIFDYTAPAGHHYSQTTSCHVGRGKGVATSVMNPTVWRAIHDGVHPADIDTGVCGRD